MGLAMEGMSWKMRGDWQLPEAGVLSAPVCK